MKNKGYRLIVFLSLFLGASCEVLDIKPEDNPNRLSPAKADVDYYLNSVQVQMGNWFDGSILVQGDLGATDIGMQLTRMTQMFGPLYTNAYTPGNMDGIWQLSYAGILADSKALQKIASEKQFYNHLAIAKILESYVYMTLVDLFGDIPFTDALKGAENFNPAVTPGVQVYAAMEQNLLSAIEDINKNSAITPRNDLFYNRDMTKWKKLANTLLMKMYVTTRLVDANAAAKFKGILNQGATAYISSAADNFQFRWSTNLTNPDSRHPKFSNNYDNGAAEYMSNYYMNLLRTDYGVSDPRVRFYFFRQETTSTADVNELPCLNYVRPAHYTATDPFCRLSNGYWGRDHGDASGIPPDNQKRTIYGLYPVGGRYDATNDTRGTQTSGGKGAGISPFMLSYYVLFMRAEAALKMGTGEDPKALYQAAVTESIQRVMNFGAEIGYTYADNGTTPSSAVVNGYINAAMGSYNSKSSDDGRLASVIREYYKAAFGNGIEMYNAYRRTGYPDDLQLPFLANPGPFIRSLLYPSRLVDRNSSVRQKADFAQPVFWDNGAVTLD